MRIHLLGTGNPFPSVKRASSSYAIHVGKDLIILDHGAGSHWRFLEAGYRSVDVTHVVISHLHYDHCADLVRLVLNRWDQGAGRLPTLKMFGPPGLRHFVERLFGHDGAFCFDLAARTQHPESLEIFTERGGKLPRDWPMIEVIELSDGDRIEGGVWEMSCRSVSHAQPYMECYGYRLLCDEGVLGYTGDITNPFIVNEDTMLPEFVLLDDARVKKHYEPVRDIVRGADLAIHYLHLPNAGTLVGGDAALHRAPGNVADQMHRVIAQNAQSVNVKTLVLTHINPTADRSGVRERVISEMGALYTGRLVWGEDLMQFSVSRA